MLLAPQRAVVEAMHEDRDPLPASLFERADTSADSLFYTEPRLVTHIDDATIGALTAYYQEILFAGATVLDLMSSCVSHLPESPILGEVVGLGMNEVELRANPRLSDFTIHDLNQDPVLPYGNSRFDFVFIAVSIQYLIRPLEVFAELIRVLRPGGQIVIAMSHRCFPTKAIRAFHVLDGPGRVKLVSEYLSRTAGLTEPEFIDRSPANADPLWLVRSKKNSAR